MNLGDYLKTAKKSLFRWEKLQEYEEDARDLEIFKKTGEFDRSTMKDWWAFLSVNKFESIVMQRVRLVTLPMTEYTKMELKIHWESAKRGDDIRTIDEDSYKKIGVDLPDFWLIDDKTVLIMKYGPRGAWEGFEVIEATDEYRTFKEEVWKHSSALQNPMPQRE